MASAAGVSGMSISGENSISRIEGLDFHSISGSFLTSWTNTSSDSVMAWAEAVVPP